MYVHKKNTPKIEGAFTSKQQTKFYADTGGVPVNNSPSSFSFPVKVKV